MMKSSIRDDERECPAQSRFEEREKRVIIYKIFHYSCRELFMLFLFIYEALLRESFMMSC